MAGFISPFDAKSQLSGNDLWDRPIDVTYGEQGPKTNYSNGRD